MHTYRIRFFIFEVELSREECVWVMAPGGQAGGESDPYVADKPEQESE